MAKNITVSQKVEGFYGNVYRQKLSVNIDKQQNVRISRSYDRGMWNFDDLNLPVEKEYHYKKVVVKIKTKGETTIRVGRSKFIIASTGKTWTEEFFGPDFVLAKKIYSLIQTHKVYGFKRNFFYTDTSIEEIIKDIEHKFDRYEFYNLFWDLELPKWVLKKAKTKDDLFHWSYIQVLLREKKWANRDTSLSSSRSKRTLFIGRKRVSLKEDTNILYSYVGETIQRILSEGYISVWTNGFWLFGHKDGHNTPLTRSWVEEILNTLENSIK